MKNTDPRLDGYEQWDGVDPFENLAGPMYFRKEADGSYRCAMAVEAQHMNGQGAIHGGALMTFADFSLFCLSRDALEGPAVTVSFNCDFTSPAYTGAFLEATGEVVHATRKMLFVQGLIKRDDTIVLRFSGLLKKISMPAQV